MAEEIEKETDGKLAVVKQYGLNSVYQNPDLMVKYNEMNSLLNREPKKEWVRQHPTVKVKGPNGADVPLQYVPIGIIEYLLTNIYIKWRVEIKDSKLIANSMVVTVRLHVLDPITGLWEFQDGIGAAPIQTDKGKGATEFNFIKSAGVQMSAPSAESYAISDAAEKFGKIFGKDINRHGSSMSYGALESKFLNK